jgi:CheY-like chemotaxis protein
MSIPRPKDLPQGSTPSPRRRGRKGILVVDDDKLVRWSVREALRANYRIWTAESAEQALKVIRQLKSLDAVLVDIRLPGSSGYDLIPKLRAERPEAKIFVMTAYDQDSAPRQAFSVRADGYLSKPFAIETLVDMMASHLISAPPPPRKKPLP